MRCAYCHETLTPSLARACAGCHTQVHAECHADLRACPTLGCDAAWGEGAPTPDALSGWTRARWWVLGVVLPVVAFGVDLLLGVDPLVWGSSTLGGHDEVHLGVRGPLIWSLVAVSVVSLVSYLARGGDVRWRWGLGVGVGLALAHVVVFVPLLPVSLIAVFALGLGVLGLSPFLALWIYAGALRRVQRQAVADPKRVGPRQGPWWVALATAALVGGVHVAAPTRLKLAAPAAARFAQIDEAQLRAEARDLFAAAEGQEDWWQPEQLPPALAQLADGAQVTVTEPWLRLYWRDDPAFPYGYSLFVRREGWTIRPSHGTCYRYVELAPGIWSGWFDKSSPPGGGPAYVELAAAPTPR